MAETHPAHVVINPDDFLETRAGRVWTPERNAQAWARSYEALAQVLANAGEGARVVIVCGVQGAGKTSWIAAQPGSAGTIYFDAALPGARHRAMAIAIARRFGAAVEAVWIRTSFETALARNARRPADKVVPDTAIRSVAEQFEEPTVAEGFERVRVIDGDGMTASPIELRQITLLDGRVLPLVAEAEGEGHRFMRRLQQEWQSGANRFQGHGECLFAAHVEGRIAAVGGLNKDPYALAETIGRLRHVYVSPAARRLGIGTILVKRIMAEAARTFAVLRLRTATAEAAAFYERLGFRRTGEEAATHVFDLHASSRSRDQPEAGFPASGAPPYQ